MKPAKKHVSFYANVFWQLLLQVTKYLFPLVTLPYLTRVLSHDVYGVYAYIVSMSTMVRVFVDFGFNLSGTKSIAEAKLLHEQNEIIGSITQARIIISVVACLVVALFVSSVQMLRGYFLYSMLAIVAICLTALAPDFVFQGHENMRSLTTRYLVCKGISTALIFVFVRSDSDLIWIPMLDIVSGILALAWTFVAAKRSFGTSISFVGVARCLRDLKEASLYCISNVASAALTNSVTLFVGAGMSDASQIAYWSVAASAISAVTSLYNPALNSLYAHMVVTRDFRFADRVLLYCLPFVLALTAAIFMFSGTIMAILGGSGYEGGAPILTALSPIAFLSFYNMLIGWPILGTAGRTRELTVSTVIAAIFTCTALGASVYFGSMSMPFVCGVRVFAELIMLAVRGYIYLKVKRNRKSTKGADDGVN